MKFLYNQKNHLFLLALLFSSFLNAYSQVASCPANLSVCENEAGFDLTGGLPAGGTFSGTGVSNGRFSPELAKAGNKTITYTYKNAASQTTTCTFVITVNAVPELTCQLGVLEECMDQPPYHFTNHFDHDSGGSCYFESNDPGLSTVWSGPGITGNPSTGYTLNYTDAGPGHHQASATTTFSNGCTLSHGASYLLAETSVVACPDDITVSIMDPPFTLTGGIITSPSMPSYNGVYFGGGPGLDIPNRTFSPAKAGEGTHPISFTYNGCGQHSVCTFNIKTVPLPVKLISFDATTTENVITLQWKTSMETGFDRFEIEKSLNPKTGFAKIHEIKGSGISNTYNFSDSKSQKGVPQYYRLKMIDTDGSFAYSKIVWGLVEGAETLSVYPNPASKLLNLESATALVEVKLTNSSGAQVFSEKLNHLKVKSLALPSLAPGIYLLHTKNVNGVSAFSRVMIR
jgi:hypothetical protein